MLQTTLISMVFLQSVSATEEGALRGSLRELRRADLVGKTIHIGKQEMMNLKDSAAERKTVFDSLCEGVGCYVEDDEGEVIGLLAPDSGDDGGRKLQGCTCTARLSARCDNSATEIDSRWDTRLTGENVSRSISHTNGWPKNPGIPDIPLNEVEQVSSTVTCQSTFWSRRKEPFSCENSLGCTNLGARTTTRRHTRSTRYYCSCG